MTTELIVLTLAGLLQVIQFALMAIPANIELGVGKTMSARDPAKLGTPLEEQMSLRTGRLKRAMNNHFEWPNPFHHRLHCDHHLGSVNHLHRHAGHHVPDRTHRIHPGLRFWLDPVAQPHLACRFRPNNSHADRCSCLMDFTK